MEDLSLRIFNDIKRGDRPKACAGAKTLRELLLLKISETNSNIDRTKLLKDQSIARFGSLSLYSTSPRQDYDSLRQDYDKIIELSEKSKEYMYSSLVNTDQLLSRCYNKWGLR